MKLNKNLQKKQEEDLFKLGKSWLYGQISGKELDEKVNRVIYQNKILNSNPKIMTL